MSIPSITQAIISVDPVFRYITLFVLTMIEGPLVTMLAGFLLTIELLNPALSFGVIIAADLLSDTGYYCIGRWGWKVFFRKSDSNVEIIEEKNRLQAKIRRHKAKMLIFGKLTHVLGVPLLCAAGAARIPYVSFLLLDGFATLVKSLGFIVLGYYIGKSSAVVNNYLTYGTVVVTGVIVLLFLVYLFAGERYKKQILSYLAR